MAVPRKRVWFKKVGSTLLEVSRADQLDAKKPFHYWVSVAGAHHREPLLPICFAKGTTDSLRDAQRACTDAVITYGQSLIVGAAKLRDPDERPPIRIYAERAGGHIHLRVFMGGLCGRLVIGVDDEKIFRALVRAEWKDEE